MSAGPGAKAVKAGSLPVSLTPVAAAATVQPHGMVPQAVPAAPATARVQVASRTTSSRLGVRGVVLSLSRTDTATGARSADLALDYRAFADVYGAGWGSRLKLYALPACALTTPKAAACRKQTPLPTTNSSVSGRASALVTLPAASAVGPTVILAQADASGDGGTFTGASQLTPDGQWSGGSGSGSFSWSYPIQVPTVPGGLQPTVDLSYDSQSVDGRTSATSPQAGWAGDGWSDTQSFVERDFVPCSQDSTDANNTPKTGDLCWSDAADSITLSLNGSSTTLVQGSNGTWHPQNDNGETVQVETDTVNGDNDNEYWVVTAGGTSYYFGLNRLPGWATGDATTNSVATVPVYGNDVNDPCHASTFAASSCQQAYRWNLDYVVDSHQDAISYWYQQAANYYGADNGTTPVKYTRDTWLDHVDYGQRAGHVYDTTEPAAAVVNYTVADRCDPDAPADCATATLETSPASDFPDVPYDQNCGSTGSCDNHGPSFWTTKELTRIATTVLVGTAQKPVDSWDLTYSFPPTNDATPKSLWLAQIKHTGLAGGSASTNPVTFTPRMLANRVSSLAGYQPITRGRLYRITTETGSVIQVDYADSQAAYGSSPAIPECDNRAGTSVVLPPGEDSNTWLCYPAYWTPPGKADPIEDWFNKYVVTGVTQSDPTGGSRGTETDYSYAGGGAWHFDDSPGTQAKYRTWDQWRGFAGVDTRTGISGDPVTLNKALFFRGMDGDKTKTGTRSVSLNDHEGDDPQTDNDALAGEVYETLSYDGDGGALLADTVTDPWLGPVTATQDRSAVGLDPLTARQVNTARVTTTTTKQDGTKRTSVTTTTYDSATGLPTQVDDKTDTDELCSRSQYAQDASGAKLPDPVRVTTVSVACGATPVYPKDLVSDERVFYDGSTTFAAAPTSGNVTEVDKAGSVATDGTPTWVTAQKQTYDEYGRPLTSTDGDNHTTTTAYVPATGAAPTEVDVVEPELLGQTAGFTTRTSYDPTRGEATKTVDAAGYTTTSAYDPLGRLTAVWDPGFSQTANPNQPNTRYSYDLSKNGPSTVTTQVLNDDGTYRTQIQLFDALLRSRETQTGTEDGGRTVTDTVYDSHGWVQKTDDAYYTTGAPSNILVQGADNQVPSSNGTVYDGAGRPTDQIAYHDATQTWDTKTAYPGSDETIVTPPSGSAKTATWVDARGHTTELQTFNPNSLTPDTVTYGYDASGNQVGQTDQATAGIPSHTWTSTYNLLGQQTSSTDPDTGTTTTTYDNDGLVLSTTDARGQQVSYTYDAMSRKTGTYNTTTQKVKTAANRVASWTYDTLAKGEPTSSTSYYNGSPYTTAVSGYDTHDWPQGSYTTIPASEGALAGTYGTGLSYTYTGLVNSSTDGAAGNLPSETVNYGYTEYGQQNSAKGSWDYVDGIAYDEFGNPQSLTYGPSTNFVRQTLGHDEQTQRLTDSRVAAGTGQVIDDTGYGYANGQVSAGSGLITSITDQQNPGGTGAATDTQCFAYDYLQRLSSAWTATDACAATPAAGDSATVGGPNPYWQSWTYDQQGNRLTQTDHDTTGATAKDVTTTSIPVGGSGNTATGTAAGSPAHGMASSSSANAAGPIAGSSITYGYDADGNTLSRTSQASTDTLTYDVQGNLSSLATTGSSTGTTNYKYDASGSLLIRQDDQSTTLYVGDEEVTLAKGSTSPTAVRHITAAGMAVAVRDGSGTVDYTIPNQQNTTLIEINASDTTQVDRRSYTPFGQQRTAAGTGWLGTTGFVGGQQDDTTGLTNLGAREYDPATGRFLTPDPLIDAGDPQQWNAYAYADNSPVAKSDPTGQMCAGGVSSPGCLPNGNGADVHQGDPGGSGIDTGSPTYQKPSVETTAAIDKAAQEEAAAEAVAEAHQAAAAHAAANAARAEQEGLGHRILSLVGDLIGVNDAVSCFTKGDVMGCISTALNFVPWGKVFKAVKVGVEAFKVWHAIEDAEEVLKGAEDLEKAADAGEDAARAEADAAQADAAADDTSGCAAAAHSFVGGTPVALAGGGTKPIQNLHAGDTVLATDPATGTTEPEKIVRLITTTTDHDFTQLTLATTGHGAHAPPATLTTTKHHPFWNATLHRWTNANQLTPGTRLREPNGTTATVKTVRNYHAVAVTYDLTVAALHTYYVVAGTTPVLVHNCDLPEIAANHRASANGGLGVKANKNIAVARVRIDGSDEVMTATSGKHANPGETGMPATRQFDPGTRPYDSETHIFETVAQRLSPESQGTIDLYSERPVCDSCEGLINQFSQVFPGIQIDITTG
ncbi:RHS repeat-associated core domain-containing protein [Streptantibioticus silvisoli]|uniref:RHS repeat-associated core domain-containing protein n=1 Tax=Streptantibioticus silvisoli TaxID=2705255 RepID=A0ABT6W2K7_9ACTN|nr:RHS repeat-associated core domain-containing protein [Streptantibioticus silvisoli]MDI5964914.1 RHS repeat-associated core domain-containing protein [Streptantibioticus silvisoli]